MALIQDSENTILFSQVSLFEITIKQTIGKLPGLQATISDIYTQAINDNFTFLPISNQHIYRYNAVPLKDDKKLSLHRDLVTVYW